MVIAKDLVKEFAKTEKQRGKTVKTTIRAVDGISIEAKDGETLGILGPNGAGKTTLLRMLGTLMEPTEGNVIHILSDGSETKDPSKVKEHMGYLSNNTKLYARFSTREFLYYLGEVYGMDKAWVTARIDEVNNRLCLNEFIDSKMDKLSTGQTQRANLARCLFSNPDLYILDEPTLGLDIMAASSIVDFMKSEKEKGKSIIYSTHYLEEAEALCDRVALINKGRIIALDSPKGLCEQTGKETLRDAFLYLIEKDGGVR